MRLILPLVALFSGCALAAPNELAAQDSPIIDRAISRAQGALKSLETTIQVYRKKPTENAVQQQRHINEDSQEAVNSLFQGADRIRSSPNVVATLEYSNIVIEANGLLAQLQKTVDEFVNAKNLIAVAGGQQSVLDLLKNLKASAKEFADALVSKTPAGDVLAAWWTAQMAAATQKAVKTYS
jgi:hypothetical protein